MSIVIPGKKREKREQKKEEDLKERYAHIVSDRMTVTDSGEKFVSLHRGDRDKKEDTSKTPWESFVARIRYVAEIEQQYYEEDAGRFLEEAESIMPDRRNFFILHNQKYLQELEQNAEEYEKQRRILISRNMEDYHMYLAAVRKMGTEPAYHEADLADSYFVERMKQETEELLRSFRARSERRYIANAMNTVMQRHNLVFEDMSSDAEGNDILQYRMDEQSGVQISRTASGAFEMHFRGRSRSSSASLDEKRAVTEKAKHFCSLLPGIRKELKEEFGITFEQTALQEPTAENIEFEHAEDSRRFKSSHEKNLRTMTVD